MDRLDSPFDRLAAWITTGPRRHVLVVLLVGVAVGLGANMVRRAVKGSSDYPMGIDFTRGLVFEGENVYETHSAGGTHTKYPPFFFVFLAPVAALPFQVGAALWYLLCLVLTGVGAWWAVRAMQPPDTGPPGLGEVLLPIACTGLLVVTNLAIGQVNVLILALVCLGLFLASRRRATPSGLALGVAVALKLTPALLVAGFLWKRAWFVVAGALLALVLCWGVLPAVVFGPERAVALTKSWSQVITGFVESGAGAESPDGHLIGYRHTNQSLDAAARRFFTTVPAIRADQHGEDFFVNVTKLEPTSKVVDRAVRAISLLLLLGLLWLARGPLRSTDRLALGLEVSLALLVMVVISPIAWDTHFVVLLVPYAAALEVLRRGGTEATLRRWMLRAVVVSIVLVTAGVSSYAKAFSLPLLGTLLLGAALAWARVAERRRTSATP